MLVITLVIAQPLSALAEVHSLDQASENHLAFDLLHINSKRIQHQHHEHQFHSPYSELGFNNVLYQEALQHSDLSDAPDGEHCDDHCGHSHASYSAFVPSSPLSPARIVRHQGKHVHHALKPLTHNSSPFRPPRY